MPAVAVQSPQVVWRPIPNSSQEFALSTRAQHTLYTGARGPGKTDTQLMRFRRFVGMGYGPFWRGIIFDREYKNLDDLINKSKRWFFMFDDGVKFKESAKDLKWVWPTGEELLFRAVKHIDDYWDYHGQEYPFIGWNELTKFPTGDLYEAMRSINRSSYDPKKDGWIGGYFPKGSELPVGPEGRLPDPIPLQMFSTANPWGAGHAWVKRQFIDAAPYGKMYIREIDTFNPRTQQREKVVITQMAIFGTYRENIYLDPIYIANLESIKDKNKRKAWLAGSWDIVAGGAIDDLWNPSCHIIGRFEIPATWRVNRVLDWGSTQPFSVGWFAESNGEEVTMPSGTKRVFPAGTLIQIAEWYGTDDIGSNKGIKLSVRAICDGIKEREWKLKGEDGNSRPWVKGDIWAGPADNQIGNVIEIDKDTIKTQMANQDIFWLESDKTKGSRKNGLQLFRDRLEASIKGEGPGYYVMNNCRASISLLPTLPRDEDDPDDIDTESEDHVWDMTRYRLLEGQSAYAANVKVGLPR